MLRMTRTITGRFARDAASMTGIRSSSRNSSASSMTITSGSFPSPAWAITRCTSSASRASEAGEGTDITTSPPGGGSIVPSASAVTRWITTSAPDRLAGGSWLSCLSSEPPRGTWMKSGSGTGTGASGGGPSAPSGQLGRALADPILVADRVPARAPALTRPTNLAGGFELAQQREHLVAVAVRPLGQHRGGHAAVLGEQDLEPSGRDDVGRAGGLPARASPPAGWFGRLSGRRDAGPRRWSGHAL